MDLRRLVFRMNGTTKGWWHDRFRGYLRRIRTCWSRAKLDFRSIARRMPNEVTSESTQEDIEPYAAFVSYRHTEPDRRWPKWLHAKIETYRGPRRLGRVFRDEE